MITSKIYILDNDLCFNHGFQLPLEKNEVRYFKTEYNVMQAMEKKPEIQILDHNLDNDFKWDPAVKIKERDWKQLKQTANNSLKFSILKRKGTIATFFPQTTFIHLKNNMP